jgi:carbonic anhydrase
MTRLKEVQMGPDDDSSLQARRLTRRELLQAGMVIGGVGAAASVLGIGTTEALGLAGSMAPAIVPTATGAHAPHWEYQGELGPEHWGSIAPEYASCATGKMQSPIDLPKPTGGSTPIVKLSYGHARLAVVNNGHTIQASAPAGHSIQFNGSTYELVQFHFHSPSEHTVAGRRFAMEVHFVHKDASGKLAVIGGLMEQGHANSILMPLWNNLPKKEGDKVSTDVRLGRVFAPRHRVYRYEGSLTTPPCTEGVTWLVFRSPLQISKTQVQAYRAIFPVSNRPLQPINGRILQG